MKFLLSATVIVVLSLAMWPLLWPPIVAPFLAGLVWDWRRR